MGIYEGMVGKEGRKRHNSLVGPKEEQDGSFKDRRTGSGEEVSSSPKDHGWGHLHF